jgi:protein-tyrosine phosphatase
VQVRVCFVCLGNICRSPTAEGVFRKLVTEAGLARAIGVESAGTGPWHVGEPPDTRATETAARRGVTLAGRGQQFQARDFERFDYVIAMDRENLRALEALRRRARRSPGSPAPAARGTLALLRAYEPGAPECEDVPDPYYGGPGGFDHVFDVCEAACRALLERIVADHGLR